MYPAPRDAPTMRRPADCAHLDTIAEVAASSNILALIVARLTCA